MWFFWVSGKAFSMHCLKCKQNTKSQMYSFGLKDVCRKLTFFRKCFECSIYKLRLLDEPDIKVALDNLDETNVKVRTTNRTPIIKETI